MSKRWWQSSTIKNAIYTYALAVAAIGINAFEREQLTKVDLTAILGATYTLAETIKGRRKAAEPIKGSEAEEKLNREIQQKVDEKLIAYTSSITPTPPDLEAISQLPSAEDAPGYATEVFEEIEKVDNEEDDGLDIDFSSLSGKYYLVAQTNTLLKTQPRDSSSLQNSDYLKVGEDKKIFIDSWKFPDKKNSHILVTIDEYKNINSGEFYVFAPHFKLFNTQGKEVEIESPTSEVPIIKKNLSPIKLPGYTSVFYLENPIYQGSHFTWAEATKNGQRMPENKSIVENIIKQAKELDKFRAWNGNRPLTVTSWYRDPRTNRAVGGASNSSHLRGDATDIFCPSLNIWDFQSKVIQYWKSGGVGKGAKRGFCHVSSDNFYRLWDY